MEFVTICHMYYTRTIVQCSIRIIRALCRSIHTSIYYLGLSGTEGGNSPKRTSSVFEIRMSHRSSSAEGFVHPPCIHTNHRPKCSIRIIRALCRSIHTSIYHLGCQVLEPGNSHQTYKFRFSKSASHQ